MRSFGSSYMLTPRDSSFIGGANFLRYSTFQWLLAHHEELSVLQLRLICAALVPWQCHYRPTDWLVRIMGYKSDTKKVRDAIDDIRDTLPDNSEERGGLIVPRKLALFLCRTNSRAVILTALYGVFCQRKSENHVFWLNQKNIAKQLRLSRKAVNEAIRTLRAIGVLLHLHTPLAYIQEKGKRYGWWCHRMASRYNLYDPDYKLKKNMKGLLRSLDAPNSRPRQPIPSYEREESIYAVQ